MTNPIPNPTDVVRRNPDIIRSPIVAAICKYVDELNVMIGDLRSTNEELRTENLLLMDRNSDLRKEITVLRQDLEGAEHDRDECHKELNRRDDDFPHGLDFVG